VDMIGLGGREGGAGFAAERRMVGPEGGTGRSTGAGGRSRRTRDRMKVLIGFFSTSYFLVVKIT
jgi:hypothetical protein